MQQHHVRRRSRRLPDYSRIDAPAVRRIQAYLKQAGLTTFLDRDQLPAGKPWLTALEQAIARCAAVAVLVGPAGLGTWQQREVQLALDRQAEAERAGRSFPVIPILLPKVEDPPGGFLRLQTWVDLRSDLADPAQLYLLLTGIRGQAPADGSALREALCPYRGLLPFREEDAGLFFGREEAIDTLLGKLRDHNLVTLVGRSGSGKSSVVFAGLIPALRRRADGRTWSILSLRPGSEPLHALVRLFDPPPVDLPPFEADQRVEQQVTILRTDNNALGRRIRSLLATAEETGTDRLLLHVDQWEELYTQALRNPALEHELAERDVTQFINLVLEATRTSSCTVVLTVRADFYGEFLKHGPLAAAVPPGQVNLGPLSREGLAAAIRKPAEAIGLTVDPPLLETLVDEVCNDIGKLPLLEYALKETWRRREGQRLTLNAYGQAGGIDGAVAQRANQIFTSLSQTQQAAARRLFVSLVTPGEGREDTRARAVYLEQDDAIAAVIDKFSAADARLLVTGEDVPTARRLVDLSHEAMIREWDLLKAWIEVNREVLRRREHIRARLRQWEEQDRDPTLLLSPGLPLEEGRKLLADHGDVLIDEVQPYIAASLAADEERQRQAEAAAEAERQRELAAAQRLAQRARVAIGLSLFLLGGVGLWMAADRGLDEWHRWQRDEKWRQAMTTAKEGRASEPIKDCDSCPEMVVAPPGTFQMGSPESDGDASKDEKPQHPVTIAEPFAIGRYEVTKAEYAAFIAATYPLGTGCYVWVGDSVRFDDKADWREPSFAQTDREPVVCVSWLDARAYVNWLSHKTGERYRLPTEAEWEYTARAGTKTRYAFGDAITPKDANYSERKLGKTAEVGSYPPNAWGLYDMHGNIWEWVEDVWHESYEGEEVPSSLYRVTCGGSWDDTPENLRSAKHGKSGPPERNDSLGFRVARTLD